MPRTGKSTISCVSSPASKGTPCDAENDRFCGKCGKLDESHVSFLRQKSNSLPVFSRLPALLKADSGRFRMHRRMFYCTVQSRISAPFLLSAACNLLHDAKSEYGQFHLFPAQHRAFCRAVTLLALECGTRQGLRLIFFASAPKALMSDLRSALLCGTVHFIRTFSVRLAGAYRRVSVGCFPNLPSK